MTPLEKIIKFNEDRNLILFNSETEASMLEEELQEFRHACAQLDEFEMVDALCDLIVVATGGIHKLGYSPTKALEETVKEITSRQGTLNPHTGKWQKDPKQDPSTLYKADYTTAKV